MTAPGTQIEYKALKNLQSGAKMLLEHKTVALDSVEKTKKHQAKLEENKKIELDDDTFNKLYTKVESGFHDYKEKKKAIAKS